MLQVVSLLCNVFKVLLLEQHLGVIAGRLSAPTDRLVRVTGLSEDYIRLQRSQPLFRVSVSTLRLCLLHSPCNCCILACRYVFVIDCWC